ncbi:MAG: serine kinase [Devosia sp.]|nr:serine kinase [Devosia sp.]
MSKPHSVHGTGLTLDGFGILLRGASGTGKSLLTLSLLEHWEGRGRPAFLVSDDRVDLTADAQGVVMHAPPLLTGLIELRGRGIVHRPSCESARLDLVVDLVADYERMPEEEALVTTLLGHRLARAPVPSAARIGLRHQELLVIEAMRASALPTRT